LKSGWIGPSPPHATIPPAVLTRKREFWNNAEPERLPDQWRVREA
jgi:hypothetical protein